VNQHVLNMDHPAGKDPKKADSGVCYAKSKYATFSSFVNAFYSIIFFFVFKIIII